MGLLGPKSTYDRGKILAAANRARARNRRKTAIALYRWLLAVEPGNAEIHERIAPMLARSGQAFDAWTSFRRAGRALTQEGHVEKALGIYREAVQCLPRQIEAWLAIAKLEQQRSRPANAKAALLEARKQFRGRRHRAEAIYLLRQVRAIEPWHAPTVLDLASLLAKTNQHHEAGMLLKELAERCKGRELRRIRAAQLRLRPSLLHTLQWLGSVLFSRAPLRATR